MFRRPNIELEDAGSNAQNKPESPEELYTSCPKCEKMCAAAARAIGCKPRQEPPRESASGSEPSESNK